MSLEYSEVNRASAKQYSDVKMAIPAAIVSVAENWGGR